MQVRQRRLKHNGNGIRKGSACSRQGTPSGLSFIQNIFPDFIELHGDRRFADDPAVIGGIATLGGRAVTVIAIEKGADTKDKVYRNFGSPNPEATERRCA